ncbi:XdhC family protein [Cellulophaga sp. HaHaR_3_176]|uniref:XdhC family protein n=1 Tax=Cellulophaga sp. HaHaR_3_176 TaxID=1942464 RepID=UPI001C1FFAAE|nr:XdhC/CoxI family protein [Cellulophaga sp. HaHaR_3_176]QWX85293.1 XdhC family protein [Cellulophaga sp. HaHaR_3_176]
MTHEFKKIISAFLSANKNGIKSVLVTVVALEGSSYRKPGVRMLLLENEQMVGAVSGGCVEKEIIRQSKSVFETSIPKIMTYDGRYRLGCEGVLYILIEPINLSTLFLETFSKAIQNRELFKISSYYKKEEAIDSSFGTKVQFQSKTIPICLTHSINNEINVLEQNMKPCFRLLIFGTEHDAVILSTLAANMGWEVIVFANPADEKKAEYFPGIFDFQLFTPDTFISKNIDAQTAIVLMNHSYSKDLSFLKALKNCEVAYIGILGPAARREKILNELIENNLDIEDQFIEAIYGPSGLNIGSITPQEIAISIIAEILTVIRKETPISLRNKINSISKS